MATDDALTIAVRTALPVIQAALDQQTKTLYENVLPKLVQQRTCSVSDSLIPAGRTRREPVDLGEDRAGGLAVDLGERPGAEHLVAAQHLEEVELDVSDVALVVAHSSTFVLGGTRESGVPARRRRPYSSVTSLSYP